MLWNLRCGSFHLHLPFLLFLGSVVSFQSSAQTQPAWFLQKPEGPSAASHSRGLMSDLYSSLLEFVEWTHDEHEITLLYRLWTTRAVWSGTRSSLLEVSPPEVRRLHLHHISKGPGRREAARLESSSDSRFGFMALKENQHCVLKHKEITAQGFCHSGVHTFPRCCWTAGSGSGDKVPLMWLQLHFGLFLFLSRAGRVPDVHFTSK